MANVRITCPNCSNSFPAKPVRLPFTDVTHRGQCYHCAATLVLTAAGDVLTADNHREDRQVRALDEEIDR